MGFVTLLSELLQQRESIEFRKHDVEDDHVVVV